MWFDPRVILLLVLPLTGCAAPLVHTPASSFEVDSISSHDAVAISQCSERQEHCLRTIGSLREASRRAANFLSPREQDNLEQALAEYLRARDELEQIAHRQKSADAELARVSLRCRAERDVELAALAMDDPVLHRALNQSFHRSGIARGSCDRIIDEVTGSNIALTATSQERLTSVIQRRGWILPTIENDALHFRPLKMVLESGDALSNQLQQGKNYTLTGLGRIKTPTTRPLVISEDQRKQIREVLQPGDILLTYTAGLTSNLIIPGNFKHAATFVGTEEDRRLANLDVEKLLSLATPNNQKLLSALTQTTTRDGKAADVVESISEGVLLNNFDHMLSTRVNRLAVLRTSLSERERAAQLIDVLSYVGDRFDFSFDLTDASAQICTEVVYRSLQGRGEIDMRLTQYAGRLTLTADDLARYCLREQGRRCLQCVLVLEQAPGSTGASRVLMAADAQERLAQLVTVGL